ncbi:MAG: hypothetical protein FWG43_00190 [Clostridiales bacterium]|nr:hypothetical protein [Clostridiales bacterium]
MKKITIISALLAMLLMSAQAPLAYATELKETGSLTMVIKHDGKALSGIDVEIYRVADIINGARGIEFIPAGDFIGSSVTREEMRDLSATNNAILAAVFYSYARSNYIQGERRITDNSGKIFFEGLNRGLFLIIQRNAPASIEPNGDKFTMQSFLVSIPGDSVDGLIYDVLAYPKGEVTPYKPPTKPPTTKPPTEPPTTPPTTTPSTQPPIIPPMTIPEPPETQPSFMLEDPDQTTILPDDIPLATMLPQTGTTRWIVPLLGAFGIIMTLIGVIMVYGTKKCY